MSQIWPHPGSRFDAVARPIATFLLHTPQAIDYLPLGTPYGVRLLLHFPILGMSEYLQ